MGLMIGTVNVLSAQRLEGVPYVVAHEISLERLQVLLCDGQPTRLVLPGSASADIRRYRTDALQSEAVSATYDAVQGAWTIAVPDVGYGYYAEESGALSTYYYVVDHGQYACTISAPIVEPVSADPCGRVRLSWQGGVEPIYYWTPSGVQQRLSRGLQVSFSDVTYDTETTSYTTTKTTTLTLEPELTSVEIEAPTVDTRYTVVGDRWMTALGKSFAPQTTELYTTPRLVQHATVVAVGEAGEALTDVSWEGLSAPTTLRLAAHANEPSAALQVWKIAPYASDGSLLPFVLHYSGAETEYTLRAAGRYRIWLELTNRDGSCTDHSFVHEVRVAESLLDVPNAFTPGSSPGTNDVFRVAARSIVRFDGRIFSRTGQELYHWSDPTEGWDGTYRGQPLPTGAYMYVITAQGADGIEYKRSGTVNLLRSESDGSMGY